MKSWSKRIVSGALAAVMVMGYVPVSVFAAENDGLCAHHPEHTQECGYAAGESPCTFMCTECAAEPEETEETIPQTLPEQTQPASAAEPQEPQAPETEAAEPSQATEETEAAEPTQAAETTQPSAPAQADGEDEEEALEPSVCADGVIASGECGAQGDNLTWVLAEDDTLTISGTGAMQDFYEAPWYTNRDNIKTVVLEPGVASIGESAFSGCRSLTGVSIPESVSSIGKSAFSGCWGLTGVSIPAGVTSIGDYTFSGCSSLTSVNIPESVASIGSSAFYDCRSLTSVTIPAGVVSIGESAFSGCSSLTSVAIPAGVASIGYGTFYGCTSLTSVSIPESVSSIGGSAFSGCTSLTSVSIPESVASIGSSAFSGCTSLTSVTIPAGVTGIAGWTFHNCSSLSSVTIPATVTSIGEKAFAFCSRLKDVYYGGGQPQWEQIAIAAENEPLTQAEIHCKDVPFTGICGAQGTNLTWTLTEDGTLTISGSGAMRDYNDNNSSTRAPWKTNQGKIKTVVLEPGVASIGEYAFYECSSLTGVTIPVGVASIGNSAFSGCTSLSSVSIPEGVTSVANRAFYGCSSLTSITIPGSVTSIGKSAFCGCSSLTGVTIPAGVTSIANRAFYGCSSLTSITIPGSVTSIGSDAFYDCSSLTDITFWHRAEDLLTIGDGAFGLRNAASVYTVVRVPNAAAVNEAIQNHTWGYNRIVGFVGDTAFAMESLELATQSGQTAFEVGVPVTIAVTVHPGDTTEDYTLSVVPEKTTAEAYLSKAGVLTTLSEGTVTLQAACVQNPAIRQELALTILPPTGALNSLTATTLNDYPGEAELGKPVQMIPVFTPANAADRTVTWSVENGTGQATIDENGVLTPTKTGDVTVYVMSANGMEGSCTVHIFRYAEEVTILLNGKTEMSGLGVGESVELSFRLSPEDTTTKDVEWSVLNNTGWAKVVTNGNGSAASLKGIREGMVTLTAAAKDSKQVIASKKLRITDTVRSYPLPDDSGSLYYNTETGWITGADQTVENALIPAQIDGVTIVGIAPYAFANRDSWWNGVNANNTLKSVSIPNTVAEIGESAFEGCVSLSTLRFAPGSQLTAIGPKAFRQCKSITTLNLPDSVQTIGKEAFGGLTGLRNLTISGELDAAEAFDSYGDSLETATLTGSYICSPKIEKYDGYTRYCYQPGRNAKKVILADSVTAICENAFSDCQNVEQVVLPEGLQTIGKHAFYNCPKLTSISIPDTVQSLGEDCFAECEKLQLLDMSKVPNVFIERETPLKGMVTFPTWLVRATGGKAEMKWSTQPFENKPVIRDWPGDVSHPSGSTQWNFWAYHSGKVWLICEDVYTGIQGRKLVEVQTGTVIRPADTGYLVSGGKITLSAWQMPAEQRVSAYWQLAAEDEEYTSIHPSTGVLTAKEVTGAQQVTVTAQPYDGGEPATKTIWILPRTTGLSLLLEDAPLGSTLNADQAEQDTLQLSARVYPKDALHEMQWTSSVKTVAQVDENGLVTLLKPGTTVIKATAKDGSKLSAQVTLHVTYVDAAKKLDLTAEAMPAIGLQEGQAVQLTLRGEQTIDPERITFAVPANQSDMGSVDENGLFTAGTRAGMVNVTAALKGDPLGRTASVSVPVIPVQAEKLVLNPQLSEAYLSDGTVVFNHADMTENRTFAMEAKIFDQWNREMESGIAWSSSDTGIAAVDANGIVTVKAGASGNCVITATAQDAAKHSGTILISVRDYTPRLETAVLNLNTASLTGANAELVESYGNSIQSVSVNDDRFTVSYENDLLILKSQEDLPRGTYRMNLEVVCQNGSYTFPLTVKASQSLPRLNIKQLQKFNPFYRGSQAALSITGGEVEYATLESDDFALIDENGQWLLAYADPDNAPQKPNTKVTVQVLFAGYNTPVTKTMTIGTVNTAPKLTLNPKASTVNTALSQDLTVQTRLTGADLQAADVWTDTEGAQVSPEGDDLTITLEEAKTANVTVYVQQENWARPVKLTHKITVTNKMPTLKAAGALKLNAWFPAEEASTPLILSQGNLSLADAELTPLAKEGTVTREESDKLNVWYDPDSEAVVAQIQDDSIRNGTYSFAYTGTLMNGTQIPGGTLRVTVARTLPKAKLSASSLRLNKQLAGEERASVKVTLTGGEGYTLVGFENLPECLSFEDGILTAEMPGEDFAGDTYALRAIVSRNGEEVTLPTSVSVRVQIYDKAPSFKLAAKGKLDLLNPESRIVYTVKTVNCQQAPEGVYLEGEDAELFDVELEDGVVYLTMAEGCEYATRRNYRVTPVLILCGQKVRGAALTIRVSQSAFRLGKLANRTVYHAQTTPLVQKLTVTSPVGAKIGTVTLNPKTTLALRNAIEAVWGLDWQEQTQSVSIPAKAFAGLKPGKYTLILDVTPENAGVDTKPIQAKFVLTVRK